jgi:hypothetical protein
MKKTEQRTLRLTPETVAKAEALSRLWNLLPDVVPNISLSAVVSSCIDRIYQQEMFCESKRSENGKVN